MSFEEAVGILIDIVRPGNSENSHDVRPLFAGAMFAYGQGDLVEKFGAVYLQILPWGVAFSIRVEKDMHYADLATEQQLAIVKSLCVVLQSGGMNAVVGEDGKIILTSDEGETTQVDIDSIVGQFRQELDRDLGPTGPDTDDPMRRWMP